MFGSLGFPELMLIFGVALLIFGPRKLPDIGRSVGRALGEFRRATNDLKSTLEHEVRMEEDRDEGSVSVLREPAAPHSATVNRGAVPEPAAPASPDPTAAAETRSPTRELEPRTANSKE